MRLQLLFEPLVLAMVKGMPVAAVARLIGEHDTRIWRILDHYVAEARAASDFSEVQRASVWTTSSRRTTMTLEQISRKPKIAELLEAKQDEMEAALSANRRVVPHEGEKGAATELRWRDMLSRYLPRRYSVAAGFVVDHKDGVSEQIDVIIHDAQYSPFLFQAGTSCFVPAESVYAVFDVKQEMNKATLIETGGKVASVRRLNRTSGKVYTNTGVVRGKDPKDQRILGGILAITSKWKEPFGPRFESALRTLPATQMMTIVWTSESHCRTARLR